MIRFENILLKDIPQIALSLSRLSQHSNIWCFEGSMGSGKTTLIKAMCEAWGVTSELSSPTFSIVNEYATNQGSSIYHFDFYRMNDADELLQIGIIEYLDSGFPCLIEWPEKYAEFLESENYQVVNLKANGEFRSIEFDRIENYATS